MKSINWQPFDIMNAEKLSQTRFGRMWLHLDCLRRGGPLTWHLGFMLRQWLPSQPDKRRRKHD